jgi:hypothetical protein
MADGSPWLRVSIVTPSYNQGEFIEETIRSVLLQGYPDIEYMVIDGGSEDHSVEIIRRYEPWLAYWISEKDRGQAHAVNKGWERARGQVLAYLNSDDMLEPNVLQRVVSAYRADPEAALIYGDCNLVNADGDLLRALGSRPYCRAGLLLADYIHQSSAFVGRAAFDQIGLLDESFHMTMDYDYWVRLAMASLQMVYLPEVLSSARLAAGTKTQSQTLKFLGDTLRVLDSVYEAPNVPEDVRRVKRKAYANAWRLGGIRYFDAGMRKAAIGAMLKSLYWDPVPSWKQLAVALALSFQSILGVRWLSAPTYEKTGN